MKIINGQFYNNNNDYIEDNGIRTIYNEFAKGIQFVNGAVSPDSDFVDNAGTTTSLTDMAGSSTTFSDQSGSSTNFVDN